jgi:hypothetical protein
MALSDVTNSPIFGNCSIIPFSLTFSGEAFACFDFPEHPDRTTKTMPIKRKGQMLNKEVYKLKLYLFSRIKISPFLSCRPLDCSLLPIAKEAIINQTWSGAVSKTYSPQRHGAHREVVFLPDRETTVRQRRRIIHLCILCASSAAGGKIGQPK